MVGIFTAAILSVIVYADTLEDCETHDNNGNLVSRWKDHAIAGGFVVCVWAAAWVLSVIVEALI